MVAYGNVAILVINKQTNTTGTALSTYHKVVDKECFANIEEISQEKVWFLPEIRRILNEVHVILL
jgi:hypothetical protein